MTLNEVIAQIKSIKPNNYSDAMLLEWISELDGLLLSGVMAFRADAPEIVLPYTIADNGDDVLLATPPYDQMYIYWLGAKIDYANSEFDRYTNSMVMYNSYFNKFAGYWARSHASLDGGYISV